VSIPFDLTLLGRQGRAHDHLDRIYDPSAFAGGGNADDEGYSIVSPVHLVADVDRQGEAYRVTGRVGASLRVECGRCLEPFEISVDSPFELRYVPAPQQARDGEHEVAEDDLTTAYYREHTIDLEDLMREQFQLALPMKPLCSALCKGLCPECGTNLNTGACDCRPTWEDPRLAALKGLLTDSKEN
jgi:uncharacterized protein